jgi:hypothetical protein
MMNRLPHSLAFALLLALLLGCAGARPKPDWATAPDADIAALATFGWETPAREAPRTILAGQIREALAAELAEKGYVQSEDAPDLVIGYEIATQEAVQSKSPVTVGFGVGSWGSNVGGSVGASVPVGGKAEPRLENRVTIRAVDPQANRELWIGTTTTLDQTADAKAVASAIAGVMKGFPDRRR